jgi:hypothetical protein
MSFVTAQGSTSTLTLDEPRADLTAADVTTAMQAIIAQNYFNTSTGDLTEIKAAEITTTTKQTLI